MSQTRPPRREARPPRARSRRASEGGEAMDRVGFTFSDTIAGYVTEVNRAERSFGVRTSDGRAFQLHLTPTTFGRIAQNLEEPYADATGRLGELLRPDQL